MSRRTTMTDSQIQGFSVAAIDSRLLQLSMYPVVDDKQTG